MERFVLTTEYPLSVAEFERLQMQFTRWQRNGGLPVFGFPLTEVITETLEDGRAYEVQYFERARFE